MEFSYSQPSVPPGTAYRVPPALQYWQLPEAADVVAAYEVP
jgi:hypothetical protein